MIIPVILAGGSGARLWPASVPERPKQFLRLLSRHSLFQQTAIRATKIGAAPVVICPAAYQSIVESQLEEIGVKATLVLEPSPRNTAPAIIACALMVMRHHEDPSIVVMPCDHEIADTEALLVAIRAAHRSAGLIKLIGVEPQAPSPHYGYVVPKRQSNFVADFVEKPQEAPDQIELIERGALFNTGIFLGRAEHFLKVASQTCPEVYQAVLDAVDNSTRVGAVTSLGGQYSLAAAVQFDRAVLERAPSYCTVTKMNGAWSDVGSFNALVEAAANKTGTDFQIYQTQSSHIITSGPHVEVLTTHPVTVVATSSRVLVVDDDRARDLVDLSKRNPGNEVLCPWGSYSSVATDSAGKWRIKRLVVNPGGVLSLQSHKNRAETWLVISGEARVTHGDKVLVLVENETIHIPALTRHRLENTQRIPLELLEIQTGNYFGEDDIVRYHDIYGRC